MLCKAWQPSESDFLVWPARAGLKMLTGIFVAFADEYSRDRSPDGEREHEADEEPVNANLPIRQYLDKHIMPSLLEALEQLTKDKPEDPIQYIGEYLLREENKLQLGNK